MKTRLLVLVLVLLATGAAIPPIASAGAGEQAKLPPSSRRELAAIFGPKVEKFGLRVTRAALVNRRQERDPDGTHLAIYVEPTGEYTPQDYIDGTVDVTRVFLPSVFTRWKGLESFDVCQEPRPAVDDRQTPAPETQVYATRAGNRLVDWASTDVATMLARSNAEDAAARADRPARFTLFIAKHLENTDAYRQAAGSVDAATSTTTPNARGYG